MPLRHGIAQAIVVCAVIGVGIFALSHPSSSGHSNYTAASAATPDLAALPETDEPRPEEVKEDLAGQPTSRVVRVRKGDTLMDILVKAGAPRPQAHQAITALQKVFNPRKLKPGQDITLTLAPVSDAAGNGGKGAGGLLGLRFEPDFEREVGADRNADGGFTPVEVRNELTLSAARARGVIKTSLYEAADAAGVPPKVLIEMIRTFSYDVDFQRDIQPGDTFEVMFERLVDDQGHVAETGKVLFASLTLSGNPLPVYRYAPDKGDSDFFNHKGESVRKALLRTPVDGARLSSRYGKRKHPVLGYTRMHRGIDFAARKGTPIVAAGNGVVAAAGRNGNYGNYISIRHNSEYRTAYAHLSRFAKGIRKGRRVKQGQVIGYVGSTGMSTGPHLHFEMMRNSRKINPLSVKMPTGRKLKDAELKKFLAAKAEIDQKLAGLPLETEVASNR
jgi:murein DD-endopeptidase MepM/ murein hydrolase activator NlpD